MHRLGGRGGLSGAGGQYDRDAGHHAHVEVVGRLPGGQGAGEPAGGERQ
ncbi:hypothetical protein ACNPQM_21375 [Streptomyces sp. NPDC056231]